MLNASFAQLGYYTEIDQDELAYQVAGLDFLLDERIALYLFKAGEPIAFVLCIPDISDFVRKVHGNLNLPNQLRLLLTRGRYRSEARDAPPLPRESFRTCRQGVGGRVEGSRVRSAR